jgi:hypothetical protein
MSKPRFQRVAEVLQWVLRGALAFAAVVGVGLVAFQAMTPRRALTVTVVVASVVVIVDLSARVSGIPWRVKGQITTLRRLGPMRISAAAGVIVAAWFPSLVTVLFPHTPLVPPVVVVRREMWPITLAGLRAEDVEHLARHSLTISNDNAVPLQNLECRLQLPEPIVEPPSLDANYVGPVAQFRALAVPFEVELHGAGARTEFYDGNGLVTTPPQLPTVPPLKDECPPPAPERRYQGCTFEMIPAALTTGVWHLSVQTLPAHKKLTLAFVTSDGPKGRPYMEALISPEIPPEFPVAKQQAGTKTFVDCIADVGDKSQRVSTFRPITIDTASRDLSFGKAVVGADHVNGTPVVLELPGVLVTAAENEGHGYR